MSLIVDPRGQFERTDAPTTQQLERALANAETALFKAEERLQNVDQMVAEPGWHLIYTHGVDTGLTLMQSKMIARQLKELVAANPMVKRGSQVRATYVWGGGVAFAGETATGSRSALTAAVRSKMALPVNKRYVFSNTAHEEFERAAYTDGNLFLLGDDKTRTFQRMPLEQITADMRNPDNHEELWAFRREWDLFPDAPDGADRLHQVVWYYTDLFPGTRAPAIQNYAGGLERVDRTKTVLHFAFNQQVGWAYGVADALPIIAWVRLYREFMANGYIMSKALAQIAYKVTSASAIGAQRASAEIALPGQAGGTFASGAGTDLSALSSAGKGYDFAAGKPLAEMIAAGIEISVDTLLAQSATQELDITSKASAQMRRLNWDDAFDRILGYLGNTRTLTSTWQDLPVEQIQRRMQAWTLARNSGAFGGDVIQKGIADTLNIANPGPVPSYYDDLLKGPGAAQQDAGGNPGDPNGGTTGAGGATGGSGQGQGGAGSGGNDHSTD